MLCLIRLRLGKEIENPDTCFATVSHYFLVEDPLTEIGPLVSAFVSTDLQVESKPSKDETMDSTIDFSRKYRTYINDFEDNAGWIKQVNLIQTGPWKSVEKWVRLAKSALSMSEIEPMRIGAFLKAIANQKLRQKQLPSLNTSMPQPMLLITK